MANRMLRDYTDSERVNMLSFQAEVLFIRLMMKADDFGSFHANPKMIKSLLFPLKADSIRDADISRWIAECEKSGLIVIYKSGHKDYLRIVNFGQRLRNMRNKFPDPPVDISPQVAASCGKSPPEKEVEIEIEEEANCAIAPHTQEQKVLYEKFQTWVKENAPRVNQLKQPITIDEFLKLKDKIGTDMIKQLLISMHNYKPLLSKSVSGYLTVLNWSKREVQTNGIEEIQIRL